VHATSETTKIASHARAGSRDMAFSLQNIRSTLIRLEETIIFGLIERAQYARDLN